MQKKNPKNGMAANNDSQCDVWSLSFCKANEIYHLLQRWLHPDH